MKDFLKHLLHRVPPADRLARQLHSLYVNRSVLGVGQRSYSQMGEDLIVVQLLEWLGITDVTYLDLGAYHPSKLSNTYLLYRRGCRGVCVEPDPELYRRIARVRRRDTCLNVGVGVDDRAQADFFTMSLRGLNTFSRDEAEAHARAGIAIQRVTQVPLVNVNRIIREHLPGGPSFVSLDVEGIDCEIIRSFDFEACRPAVFCIETLDHLTWVKDRDTIALMESRGYVPLMDTYINTIFVEGGRWQAIRPRADHDPGPGAPPASGR